MFLLVLGSAVLVSLLVPATRELHALTVRMLCHLHGKTIVQGQPAGCALYVLPNMKFSDEFRAECLAGSTASPEAFILALNCQWHRVDFPRLPEWLGHPLLEWGALEAAAQTLSVDDGSDGQERLSKSAAALEIIRAVQAAKPYNGALWLAEASVLFDLGEDDLAIEALRTAAKNPAWNCQTRELFYHARETLTGQGFSDLDSSADARILAGVGPAPDLMRAVRRATTRALSKAVADGDDEAALSLLRLRRDLCKPTWSDVEWPNYAGSADWDSDDLLSAMATRVGMVPVSLGNEGFDEFQARVLDQYMRHIGGLRLYEEICAEGKKAGRRLREHRRAHEDPRWDSRIRYGLLSSLGGANCLFLLTGILMVLAWELAFREINSLEPQRKIVPRRAFSWLVIVAAWVVTAWLLHSAAEQVSEVGLVSRPADSNELIPAHQAKIWMAVFLPLCWFAILLLCRQTGKRVVTAILIASLVYLAVTAGTAYLRHETAKLCEPIANCTCEIGTSAADMPAPSGARSAKRVKAGPG